MSNNMQINSEKDKMLAQTIIDLFLGNKSYDEIALETNESVEFVKLLLNYRKMIVSIFGDDVWESVTVRKREIEKIQKEKRKEIEYKQTMSNILYYMTNSLYNVDEIAERVFVSNPIVTKMLADIDYIKEKFGEQMVENLKKSIDIRKKYRKSVKDGHVFVKNPKYRSLIYPDIIMVTNYQYSLIEKVFLFFEYDGDTQKIAMNSKITLNTIVASLNDSCLKDILLESVYNKLQTLLEVDSILTQNRLEERKQLVKNVVSVVYAVQGDIESLTEIIGYPIKTIERILNHPFTSIACKEMGIDVASIQLNINEEIPKEKTK